MNGSPCAFHDQSMEQLRATMLDIKEQLREGIDALKQQSKVFQETITKILESQTARQALCAQQNQRLIALEGSQVQHRTDHTASREEQLKDRAELWAAINKLRIFVYVGLGVGIVLQILAPFIIGAILKG